MAPVIERRLHWMQRVALVRHNLHSASRTGDFTFFKTIQAETFSTGNDHVAALNAMLGDEADTVLHTLDDLNAGLAYVHQDSFKTVYDSIRQSISEGNDIRRANIMVDASQQRQKADFAIDKMTNSAIDLIEQQPSHCQDTVASVWIFGTTIIADAMKVCIDNTDMIQKSMDNYICLEYSWQAVQTAVESAVSAIRGILSLMAPIDANSKDSRQASASSIQAPAPAPSFLRKLSTVLLSSPIAASPPPQFHSQVPRNTNGPPIITTPSSLWQSVTNANPTTITKKDEEATSTVGRPPAKLSPIPPSPFYNQNGNPFEINFNSAPSSNNNLYRVDEVLQDSDDLDPGDPMSKTGDLDPKSKTNTNNDFTNGACIPARATPSPLGPQAIAV